MTEKLCAVMFWRLSNMVYNQVPRKGANTRAIVQKLYPQTSKDKPLSAGVTVRLT